MSVGSSPHGLWTGFPAMSVPLGPLHPLRASCSAVPIPCRLPDPTCARMCVIAHRTIGEVCLPPTPGLACQAKAWGSVGSGAGLPIREGDLVARGPPDRARSPATDSHALAWGQLSDHPAADLIARLICAISVTGSNLCAEFEQGARGIARVVVRHLHHGFPLFAPFHATFAVLFPWRTDAASGLHPR